jgi:flagellar protein FlaF
MEAFGKHQESIAHPGLASLAYRGVVRRTTAPRNIEYRVFAEITLELENAETPGAPLSDRINAVQRNRTLWWTLACDAAGDTNPLPADLRANIISLALWVDRESGRVLRRPIALAELIAVNRKIISGLQPVAAEAS